MGAHLIHEHQALLIDAAEFHAPESPQELVPFYCPFESFFRLLRRRPTSRQIVTSLTETPHMGIYNRRPAPGLIHHSARGSQYTSVEFGSRLKESGLFPSMGSVADAYDNSLWPRA